MCEILGGSRIDDFTIIDCTLHEQPYDNANIMRIFNDDSVFETADFKFEKFTECFSPNKTLSIVTKAAIPEKFLMKGSRIELIIK